jgi:hypothetical protein
MDRLVETTKGGIRTVRTLNETSCGNRRVTATASRKMKDGRLLQYQIVKIWNDDKEKFTPLYVRKHGHKTSKFTDIFTWIKLAYYASALFIPKARMQEEETED